MQQPNIDPSLYRLDSKQTKGSIYSTTPLDPAQLEREFNGFEPIRKEDPVHHKILLELFPKYLIESCDDADRQLFEAMSRFDRKNNTFVVGCYDNQSLNFKLISYKWRYKSGIKWKTRAGTSPNGTPFVRIYTDDEPIYVIEGHRDALTAVLLGLDFIMIPFAGFKLNETLILRNEAHNRDLVFLVEDEAAYKCMKAVATHLTKDARSIKLIALSDRAKEKVDLSDYIQQFYNKKEALDGLRNRR